MVTVTARCPHCKTVTQRTTAFVWSMRCPACGEWAFTGEEPSTEELLKGLQKETYEYKEPLTWFGNLLRFILGKLSRRGA
jgi:hypothetical protein